MAKYVRLCREILVTVSNKIGVLADISRVAAQLSINIEAVAGYATETDEARLMIVTFDNARLMQTLKSKGYILIKDNDYMDCVKRHYNMFKADVDKQNSLRSVS